MNFQDKVVIITGAGSGLGRELAFILVEEEAKVVLAGMREQRLESTKWQTISPESCLAVRTDLAVYQDIKNLVEQTVTHFGQIDILVNCAATPYGGELTDYLPEEIERIIRVNTVAPIWLSQITFPFLKQSEEAMIVNISSVSSLIPTPYFAIYCASKHALYGFSESLRMELHNTNIHILNVFSGSIDTETTTSEYKRVKAEKETIAPTFLSPEKVAQKIVRMMVKKKKRGTIVSFSEKIFIKVHNLFPYLSEHILKMIAPKKKQTTVSNTHALKKSNALEGD